VKVKTVDLAKTGYSIPKLICEDMPLYDIMIKAYRKAKGHTGKKYFPIMRGRKVSVIIKGKSSGVTLTQDSNISDASYSDTVDNMIDRVRIYSEKGKRLGMVQNKKNVSKYGIYQCQKGSKGDVRGCDKGSKRHSYRGCPGDIRLFYQDTG